LSIIERICKQKTTTTNISTTTNGVYTSPTINSNNDRTLNQKRRDIEIFSGFLPAIEICQIDWNNCSYYPSNIEENISNNNQRPWSEYIRYYDETLTDGYSKLNTTTNFNFNTQQQIIPPTPSSTFQEETNNHDNEEKCQDNDSGEESCGGGNGDQRSSSHSSDECQIYFSDQQPITKSRPVTTTAAVATVIEPYILKTLKIINDPLQVKTKKSEILLSSNKYFDFRLHLFVVKHCVYMVIILKSLNLPNN
jgi:hypothetical protein